jgi:hypothetical protein
MIFRGGKAIHRGLSEGQAPGAGWFERGFAGKSGRVNQPVHIKSGLLQTGGVH